MEYNGYIHNFFLFFSYPCMRSNTVFSTQFKCYFKCKSISLLLMRRRFFFWFWSYFCKCGKNQFVTIFVFVLSFLCWLCVCYQCYIWCAFYQVKVSTYSIQYIYHGHQMQNFLKIRDYS